MFDVNSPSVLIIGCGQRAALSHLFNKRVCVMGLSLDEMENIKDERDVLLAEIQSPAGYMSREDIREAREEIKRLQRILDRGRK